MIGSSLTPPSAICCWSDSSVRRLDFEACDRLLRPASGGRARSAAPWRRRPAPGTCRPATAAPPRPSTSTGVDGPAVLIERPRSSMSARTLPTMVPAMTVSPTLSVPSCTSTVATGTAAAIELGFEHGARRGALRVGLEVADVGDEQHHLEQRVEVLALLRRDRHHDRVAAPVLGQQADVGERLLDALRVGVRLVDLVDARR